MKALDHFDVLVLGELIGNSATTEDLAIRMSAPLDEIQRRVDSLHQVGALVVDGELVSLEPTGSWCALVSESVAALPRGLFS